MFHPWEKGSVMLRFVIGLVLVVEFVVPMLVLAAVLIYIYFTGGFR